MSEHEAEIAVLLWGVALSRFAGVTGYRTPDGEVHATREDAQEWLCEQRQQEGAES